MQRLSGWHAAILAVATAAVIAVPSAIAKTSASTAAAKGQAEQLIACGEGTFPPVEFFDSNHKAIGSELDIAGSIAASAGYKLVYHQIQFNGLIPALLANQCDIITAGLFFKPERAKVINFAIYSQNGQLIMVKKGNSSNITGLNDSLAGKHIGMVAGYTTIPAVQAACDKIKSHGKDPCQVVQFATSTDINEALNTGKVDAIIDSATSIGYAVKKHPTLFQAIDTPLLQPSKVGFGFRKNEGDLLAIFKKGVAKYYADGTMCKILNKWSIGSTALPPHHC